MDDRIIIYYLFSQSSLKGSLADESDGVGTLGGSHFLLPYSFQLVAVSFPFKTVGGSFLSSLLPTRTLTHDYVFFVRVFFCFFLLPAKRVFARMVFDLSSVAILVGTCPLVYGRD